MERKFERKPKQKTPPSVTHHLSSILFDQVQAEGSRSQRAVRLLRQPPEPRVPGEAQHQRWRPPESHPGQQPEVELPQRQLHSAASEEGQQVFQWRGPGLRHGTSEKHKPTGATRQRVFNVGNGRGRRGGIRQTQRSMKRREVIQIWINYQPIIQSHRRRMTNNQFAPPTD